VIHRERLATHPKGVVIISMKLVDLHVVQKRRRKQPEKEEKTRPSTEIKGTVLSVS
jgi:hypothetical protein